MKELAYWNKEFNLNVQEVALMTLESDRRIRNNENALDEFEEIEIEFPVEIKY